VPACLASLAHTTPPSPRPAPPRPALSFSSSPRQVDSRRPTCATIKFGTGYRRAGDGLVKEDLSEPSPGPGQYKLPGGVATAAKGSPYRNSPAAMLSGRNKFGSPW